MTKFSGAVNGLISNLRLETVLLCLGEHFYESRHEVHYGCPLLENSYGPRLINSLVHGQNHSFKSLEVKRSIDNGKVTIASTIPIQTDARTHNNNYLKIKNRGSVDMNAASVGRQAKPEVTSEKGSAISATKTPMSMTLFDWLQWCFEIPRVKTQR